MEHTEGSAALEMAAPDMQPDEGEEVLSGELFIRDAGSEQDTQDERLKAVLEAVIYITDEPLSAAQMASALGQPAERVARLLEELAAEYNKPEHGLTIREVAGGYKMGTKAEHHESIRAFVKSLKPPLKLSLPALETLAVVAYKQPITAPEIMEIRGVQGAGVLKTLIDRKLIAPAGRKNVIGKPILYKTTREFLIQFGLKDVSELPTLKEFEELGRLAWSEGELEPAPGDQASAGPPDPEPEQQPGVEEPDPDPHPMHDPDPADPNAPDDPDRAPVKA
jgi:segregation and condensation protein B